jgi:hypothetical protein
MTRVKSLRISVFRWSKNFSLTQRDSSSIEESIVALPDAWPRRAHGRYVAVMGELRMGTRAATVIVVAFVIAACSGGSDKSDCSSQAQCDTIANDIRNAAKARNIPTQGICSANPPPDFKSACDALRDCNAHLC